MMSRTPLLALLIALPALAVAGSKVHFELTRSESAAVEDDAFELSRLRNPTTRDLSKETSALFDEAFAAAGEDDVPDADVHVELWPPKLVLCGPPKDGYATCCTLGPSEAWCNNSSSD